MSMDIYIKLKSQFDTGLKGIENTKKSLTSLGRSTKSTDKDMEKFYSTLKKNNNAFSNMTKDANRSAKSITGLSASMRGFNQLLGVGKLYAFGQGLGTMIQSAVDMIETTNLFNVAMGDTAVATNELVGAMHEAFGFDTTNIQSAIGTYNLLARSMGMTSENAQVLSTNTTKLAKDLSSLTNVPLNQVMQDLRSGLVGQSETVYKYGIDITEASLKQEAMYQGISKSVRNMSQGEKMGLRYSAMIRQTSLAHGDFARTIDTPANQLKIMGERFVTLSRSIGSIFIPALTSIMPYVNALLQVLNSLFQTIAKVFGYKPPEVKDGIGNQFGVDDANEGLDGTADKLKKLKSIALGMDELNVIAEPSDSASGGGGASVGGMDFDLKGYDDMMDKVVSKSQVIVDNMNKVLGIFKELSMPLLLISWYNLKDSADALWEAFKPFAGQIGKGLAYFYTNVLVPLGVWSMEKGIPAIFNVLASVFNVLTEVLEALSPLGVAFIEGFLSPLGEFTGDTFVTIMEEIADILNAFAEWIGENQEVVRSMTTTILGFFLAWKVTELMAFIQMSGGVVGALNAMTTAIKTGTLAKLIDKAETIYLTTLYAKDFVLALANGTVAIMKQVGAFILMNVQKVIATTSTLALNISVGVYNGLVAISTALTTAFGIAMVILTSPITLVIIAVGLLVAGIILLIKNWEKVKPICEEAVQGLKDAWQGVSQWFYDKVIKPIANFWDGLIEKVKSFLFMSDSANESKSNRGTTTVTTRMNTTIKNPKLARGGSLERGSLFEAGEFGKAEAIGSYNGKTTVMPLENTDFVGAIYSAVLSAMSQSNNGGGQIIENVLNLDGEVIYKNQQKVSTSRGNNFGLGAFQR